MNDHPISRRTVLKAGVTIVGALALNKQPFLAEAREAPEQPTLVVLWLNGGPAGLFNSADSFLRSGAFGVTADNIRHLGHGLCVDAGSFGALPNAALAHMASIDFRHGLYPHANARAAMLENASGSRLLRMAAAMPEAAARCVVVNSLGLPTGIAETPPMEGGVALEHCLSLDDAHGQLPIAQFDAIRSAYGVSAASTAIDSQRTTFAGIESLVHAGAGVIFAQPAYTGRPDRQFDTHHDDAGTLARDIMAPITPSLITFLGRVMTLPRRNVVVLLTGEFSRTLPGSDHAPGGTATVIGKYVRAGTAGRQGPGGSPSEHASPPDGLWAFIAAALHVDRSAPFGRNPHRELIA